MDEVARPPGLSRATRAKSFWVVLLAAVLCVIGLAVAGGGWPGGTTGSVAQEPSRSLDRQPASGRSAASSYTLMQMNLCLSGLAGCYGTAAYPAVVDEAVARIRAGRPDAVTFNEACRGDAERIARRTGYHVRFSMVIYLGSPLQCIDPGGRGLFGDAVLTKAPIEGSDSHGFPTQSGIEQRVWLCVSTRRDVDVCTAHLSTRASSTAAATNDAQCTELAQLLARRAAAGAVIFGGDVNRVGSCAPRVAWTRTDSSADLAPGIQHVYGSRATLRSPSVEVLPAIHSDHDVLQVRARLVRR